MNFDKSKLLKNIGIGSYNFKPQPIVKEQLTDSTMKDLFGASYKQVVCFDFSTGCWNRNKYMGFTMGNQSIDTAHAVEMRRVLEMDERMVGYELVAVASMAVSDDNYPGTNQTTSDKLSYKRSRNIVATVVLREKSTGKIVRVPNVWIGVDAYSMMSVAAFYGADGFVYKMANNYQMRNKFLDALVHQLVR